MGQIKVILAHHGRWEKLRWGLGLGEFHDEKWWGVAKLKMLGIELLLGLGLWYGVNLGFLSIFVWWLGNKERLGLGWYSQT